MHDILQKLFIFAFVHNSFNICFRLQKKISKILFFTKSYLQNVSDVFGVFII